MLVNFYYFIFIRRYPKVFCYRLNEPPQYPRLARKRGQQGDALKVLIDMLKRMGHLEHEGVTEAREKFKIWKAEWVAANQ